ncbi:TPA: toxin TcdB middle/C-terminal domain-containing protein [Serratia marcescens]
MAAAPARQISWFATGVEAIDVQLPDEFWSGDKQALPGFTTRFTRFDAVKSIDEVIIPDAELRYWLNRALKGTLLRNELYGEDDTALADVPYTVSEYRPQARLLSGITERVPSVLPLILESRDWQYDRIVSDPRCDQQTVLQFDELGLPCDSLSIAYPRRNKPTDSPYPTTLPEGLFDASYDKQQQYLRMSRSRSTFHTLSTNTIWMPGLADTSRLDIGERSADSIPADGVTLEWCQGSGKSVLPGSVPDEYAGHTRTLYAGKNNLPDFPPLIAATETAELDTPALSAFDTILSPESLAVLLAHSGRYQVAVPFNNSLSVYVSQQELTTYAGADAFYRPLSQRQTTLTGATTLKWDTHYCAIASSADAAGLSVHAVYDYRFLAPVSLRDTNDNLSLIQTDALGRVVTSRFSGTENGRVQGYTFPEAEPVAFAAPTSVDEALALRPGIPVAGLQVYCPLSWMPVADTRQPAEGVTEDGYISRLAWRRRHGRVPVPDGTPPHTMSILTDRYDDDPQQQLRQTLSFSDGFGRLLQAAVRQEAGEAWQRDDSGALVSGEGGPVSGRTDFRWAVTGRTEFDSKGQIVRAYQPYFLNTWQYVSDDSARRDIHADTHTYDPVGREINVVTAKGGIRRALFTPWFVVGEDENDTQA